MALKRWDRTSIMVAIVILATGSPLTALADGTPAASDSRPPTTANRPAGNDRPTVPRGGFVAGAFAGTWYSFVDNTAFTVVIEQEGRIVKLAHTAVYDYGRRVDSSFGGVSMVGVVEGSTAYVEWKSGLSPESGRATLSYLPGSPVTLHWKIVSEPPKPSDSSDAGPVEVAYFLPQTAYLIRK